MRAYQVLSKSGKEGVKKGQQQVWKKAQNRQKWGERKMLDCTTQPRTQNNQRRTLKFWRGSLKQKQAKENCEANISLCCQR